MMPGIVVVDAKLSRHDYFLLLYAHRYTAITKITAVKLLFLVINGNLMTDQIVSLCGER
jgi:hypothetical protein